MVYQVRYEHAEAPVLRFPLNVQQASLAGTAFVDAGATYVMTFYYDCLTSGLGKGDREGRCLSRTVP